MPVILAICNVNWIDNILLEGIKCEPNQLKVLSTRITGQEGKASLGETSGLEEYLRGRRNEQILEEWFGRVLYRVEDQKNILRLVHSSTKEYEFCIKGCIAIIDNSI